LHQRTKRPKYFGLPSKLRSGARKHGEYAWADGLYGAAIRGNTPQRRLWGALSLEPSDDKVRTGGIDNGMGDTVLLKEAKPEGQVSGWQVLKEGQVSAIEPEAKPGDSRGVLGLLGAEDGVASR
jgi:hypothetical protein